MKLFQCEEKWPEDVFFKKLKTRTIILIGKAGAKYIGCSFQPDLNLCFEVCQDAHSEGTLKRSELLCHNFVLYMQIKYFNLLRRRRARCGRSFCGTCAKQTTTALTCKFFWRAELATTSSILQSIQVV